MEKLNLDYWVTALSRLSEVFGNEEAALCRLDGAIGDGDHGTAMALGFSEAAKHLATEPPSDIGALARMTGNAFVNVVGGVSGIIFGTMFIEAAKTVAGKEEIDTGELASMFQSALAGVKLRGKVKEGDKSMVDALRPAVNALKEAAARDLAPKEALHLAAEAAENGAEATRHMQAIVGRARYQKDKGAGHVDAGATSVALMFRTLAETTYDNPHSA